MHTRKRTWLIRSGIILVCLLVIAAIAVPATFLNRLARVQIEATDTSPAQTYLIIGNDSRERTPTGLEQGRFGNKEKFAGDRADVILLVHRFENGQTSTTSVPRDLIVHQSDNMPTRLAITFRDGAQETINALCTSFDIGIDHVIIIDGAGLTDTVNALGGVQMSLEHAVRDPKAALDLPAGTQMLDGSQALALARSRHPEQFIDGKWVKPDETTGAQWRTVWSAKVFTALQQQLGEADPVTMMRVAWTLAGNVSVDDDMGLPDLFTLARSISSPTNLPTESIGELAVSGNAHTQEALAAAGLNRGCHTPD